MARADRLDRFSRWDDGCLACVVLYNTQTNTMSTLGNLRSAPMWASSTGIWWTGEERCEYPSCNAPAPTLPTDRVYAYDVNSGVETLLPFSFVDDVWPRI
jgi:hypothetical protein